MLWKPYSELMRNRQKVFVYINGMYEEYNLFYTKGMIRSIFCVFLFDFI